MDEQPETNGKPSEASETKVVTDHVVSEGDTTTRPCRAGNPFPERPDLRTESDPPPLEIVEEWTEDRKVFRKANGNVVYIVKLKGDNTIRPARPGNPFLERYPLRTESDPPPLEIVEEWTEDRKVFRKANGNVVYIVKLKGDNTIRPARPGNPFLDDYRAAREAVEAPPEDHPQDAPADPPASA